MSAAFDISPYLSSPAVDVPGGVALGVALVTALPAHSPATVRRAAKRLRASTIALQAAWQATRKAAEGVDRRAADHRMDVAWGAAHGRLSAYAALPANDYPRAEKAARLMEKLFPEGLGFLTLPYSHEWAESGQRLALLDDKAVDAELRELVGDDFVDELDKAHAAYGDALGITEAQAPPDVVRVQEPLRDLEAAVRDYALQIGAAAGDQPDFAAAAQAALAPIDRAREDAARAAGSSGNGSTAGNGSAASTTAGGDGSRAAPPALPAVTPDSPVPDIPDAGAPAS